MANVFPIGGNLSLVARTDSLHRNCSLNIRGMWTAFVS
jgi:hypothetical protein